MELGIRGRKALLCGASRGLGKAAAMAVAKEGVDVTIVARRRDILERTASEIRDATGVRVTAVAADIATEGGRTAALAACAEPDILLNNADGPAPGDFRTWKREIWIEALDAMMLAPIEMMRLTVDGMMARGFGRIINISSRSVKIPQLELGLSNGARAGLVGFVAGLARQTVHRNVTINNILPASSTATLRSGTSRACSMISARRSSRSGRSAPRPVPPSAMGGRRSSAPTSPSSVRRMRATFPDRIC